MQLLAVTSIGTEAFLADVGALADRHPFRVEDSTQLGDDVATVVRSVVDLADDETVLFGHSMHGTLMLAAAAETKVRGVIAMTPPPALPPDPTVNTAYWEAKAEPERKARAAAIRAEFDTDTDADKPMLYARYNSLRYFYDVDHPVPEPDEWTTGAEWAQAVMPTGADIDWPTTFDRIRVPVFLALGEYDFFAPPTPWFESPPRPGWTVELFNRSGHNPCADQPDEFVAAVERWIAAI